VVGDIYSLEERGRIQGVFSGVWAISSLVGPAAGGLITDLLSWRWVFYLNLPFGVASILMLHWFLREEERRSKRRLDFLGTLSLTASIALLLLALLEGTELWGWTDVRTLSMMSCAGAGLALFLWQEKRAPEPMLPLELFQNRVIAVASAGGFLMGTVLFCAAAFVPMFTQGVLGGTAVDAGMTLAPMSIGWPIASTTAGWFLARVPQEALGDLVHALDGGLGSIYLAMAGLALVGVAVGFLSTPYLLAVQKAVPRHQRGVATSSVQFFRTIGGSIAVAALGAVLNAHRVPQEALGDLVHALDGGLGSIYLAMAGLALVGVAVGFLFPKGSAQTHAYSAADPGASK